jgi:hypothetical protein
VISFTPSCSWIIASRNGQQISAARPIPVFPFPNFALQSSATALASFLVVNQQAVDDTRRVPYQSGSPGTRSPALFLGYLVGIYKTTLISAQNANGLQKSPTDDDDDDDTPRKTNRYIVALTRLCRLLPRSDSHGIGCGYFQRRSWRRKRIVVVISCRSMAMVVV